jgi:hypothetical protein
MATPNDRENRSPAPVPNATTSGGPFYGAKTETVTIDGKTYTGVNPTTGKPPAATEIGMISPSSGLAITGTERNMTKEREAMNLGYTKEYIASRGGINTQGYFNDTPLNSQLTAEEYRSVTKADGTIDTQKMLAILNAKGGQTPIGLGGGIGGSGAGGAGGGTGGSTAGGVGSTEAQKAARSAYDLLFEQFNQYGLGGLIEPLKGFIVEGISPAEFTIRLRETEPYKKRFAANAQRVAKGLRALSEAEYIELEDQYQNVMRNYGLPATYYQRGDMGRQEGFEKFIAGDVSVAELEDRIQTAQNRVINAAPEVAASLKSFYPDITNGDILAYALDPEKAISNIKRKVTAAEIGAGAAMAGLATSAARAEELQRYGVTGEAAREGFRAVAEVAPRGSQLAEFYKQTPYTQTTAEQEVFGLTGATEAAKQRKKLTQLEQSAFSGQAGIAGGALARDRAGAF